MFRRFLMMAAIALALFAAPTMSGVDGASAQSIVSQSRVAQIRLRFLQRVDAIAEARGISRGRVLAFLRSRSLPSTAFRCRRAASRGVYGCGAVSPARR